MNATPIMLQQRIYSTPVIERVILDNEISLALESSPPVGPDELVQNKSQSNNPFKSCNS